MPVLGGDAGPNRKLGVMSADVQPHRAQFDGFRTRAEDNQDLGYVSVYYALRAAPKNGAEF